VVKNDPRMHTAFLFVPLGLYALYNVVLLTKHGQDFGKRAMKLRIVGDDGTPAGFGRAFLRRELVVILLLVGIVPLAWKLYQMQKMGELAGEWQRAGWQMFLPNRMKEVLPAVVAVLFSAMNALMIFNKDGKCIHDRLAKTRVRREGDSPDESLPAPTVSRPSSIPPPPPPIGVQSLAHIPQHVPVPATDLSPPRRGSLADYVAQATKELPTNAGVKKGKLADDEPAADQFAREVRYHSPASPSRRLGAWVVDFVIWFSAGVVGYFLMRLAPPAVQNDPRMSRVLQFMPGVLYWIVTLYLIQKRGQNIGKRILGIRVVRDDGAKVGLWRGFFRRQFAYFFAVVLAMWLLSFVLAIAVGPVSLGRAAEPIVLMLYAVVLLAYGINYLAIFRDTRQCIHDQLAGTIVVNDHKP
jgi:uncharacterized RDD family membrane protein YckC